MRHHAHHLYALVLLLLTYPIVTHQTVFEAHEIPLTAEEEAATRTKTTKTSQQQQQQQQQQHKAPRGDEDLKGDKHFREQVQNLEYYEVVVPVVASDHGGEGRTTFAMDAFDTTFRFQLPSRQRLQYRYNTFVEYYGENNTYEAKFIHEDSCFYSGFIPTTDANTRYEVVLNYCDGVEGMIRVNESSIFIEPVRSRIADVRAPGSKGRAHIAYRAEHVRFRSKNDSTGEYGFQKNRDAFDFEGQQKHTVIDDDDENEGEMDDEEEIDIFQGETEQRETSQVGIPAEVDDPIDPNRAGNQNNAAGMSDETNTTTEANKGSRERRAASRLPYDSFLTFVNKCGRSVQLYYLNALDSPVPFTTFVVDEMRSVNTYSGTVWVS